MADPTEPTTEATTATTEPAAPSADPPAPVLTLDMVRALIAEETRKAHDAGAAAARRAMEGKQAKPAATQPPKTEATAPVSDGNDAAFAEDLADAINEYPFDKEQRRAIRDAARSKRPDDVDGFVAQWARMFGKAGAAPSPTQPQPNQQPAAAKAPASIPSTPPPAGTPPDGSLAPVFRAMSEDDRRDAFNAYIRRQGGNPANLRAPETRKALGVMRRDFESAAAITDVAIGARPTR